MVPSTSNMLLSICYSFSLLSCNSSQQKSQSSLKHKYYQLIYNQRDMMNNCLIHLNSSDRQGCKAHIEKFQQSDFLQERSGIRQKNIQKDKHLSIYLILGKILIGNSCMMSQMCKSNTERYTEYTFVDCYLKKLSMDKINYKNQQDMSLNMKKCLMMNRE